MIPSMNESQRERIRSNNRINDNNSQDVLSDWSSVIELTKNTPHLSPKFREIENNIK